MSYANHTPISDVVICLLNSKFTEFERVKREVPVVFSIKKNRVVKMLGRTVLHFSLLHSLGLNRLKEKIVSQQGKMSLNRFLLSCLLQLLSLPYSGLRLRRNRKVVLFSIAVTLAATSGLNCS